jgi:lysophospholipase L1-like esterase
MKLLYAVLLLINTLFSCTKKAETAMLSNTSSNNSISPASANTISFLALGDSYTIGESVLPAQSFPYQLAAQLSDNYRVETPTIIAATGWTTDNLITVINRDSIANKKFDFVTLLIGVNDQYQGLSQANYRTKFAQVLSTAIAFADHNKTRVFVLSIPNYGVTPFAAGRNNVIAPQIYQFNAINRDESQKAGVNYVDITDLSLLAGNNLNLTANDGLHPSAAMYALWVQRLAPLVTFALKQ